MNTDMEPGTGETECIYPKVLFFIKSAPANEERRTAQQERWLRALPQNATYFYCIGSPVENQPRIDGHHLLLPCEDHYHLLLQKMKILIGWVISQPMYQDCDFIVTLDDDVVVEVDRLYQFLQVFPDHFGNRWNGDPAHISGMFVGYSKRAFSLLANTLGYIPDLGHEDLLISRAVHSVFANLNVMTDCSRFRPHGSGASVETIAIEIRPFSAIAMREFAFPDGMAQKRISFCLYGNDLKYVTGALINVELAARFYPGWEVIFYVKDVPRQVIVQLQDKGAIIRERAYANMMLARFLPFAEEGIVLSRDCDSRISGREVRAVNEWLASDKPAHLIRDHPEHIPGWAMIPGGLWGSRLPFGTNLRQALWDALDNPLYGGQGGDQKWLVDHVWRPEGFFIHQYNKVEWMQNSYDPQDFCGMRHEITLPDTCNEVVLFEGFFNRINGLVNAYLIYGPEFTVKWSVNRHLPHAFSDIFHEIPGLQIQEVHDLDYWPVNTDPAKGPLCYWFVSRNHTVNLERVAQAYQFIFRYLKIPKRDETYRLGIQYRGLHRASRVSPEEFANWCVRVAKSRNIHHCYAMADTAREAITRIISESGIKITWGIAAPMENDLDRSPLSELQSFIQDALTLAECDTVLTSFAETTVIDPAQAFGRQVLAYSGSRAWSECWFHHVARLEINSRPPSAAITRSKETGNGASMQPLATQCVTQETDHQPNSKVTILVAVSSPRSNRNMRAACRNTWAVANLEGIAVQFFTGGGAVADEADTTGLLASDDPRESLAKVMVMFRYALKQWDFEWLFKCDDGMYVDLHRLSELICQKADLMGDAHLWQRGSLNGKAGYLVSRAMVEKLVAYGNVTSQGDDEGMIGKEILRLGGAVKATEQLSASPKPYPRWDNKQISARCGDERAMRTIHTVRDTKPLHEWQVEQRNWKDSLLVWEDGSFSRKSSYCLGSVGEDARSKILYWHDWAPERLIPLSAGAAGSFQVCAMNWHEDRSTDAIDILVELVKSTIETELVRYGPPHDGGYLLPAGVNYNKVITIGVGNDISFEVDYARSHPSTRYDLFDPTIDRLPEPLLHSTFHREGVGNSAYCKPITELLAGRILEKECVLLKMDCEGAEWQSEWESFDFETIHTFVLEIHHMLDPQSDKQRKEVLSVIAKHFALVHIHPNNYSRSGSIRGRLLSDCIELTLVHRKQIGSLQPRRQLSLPDFDNAPHLPSAVLKLYPSSPTCEKIEIPRGKNQQESENSQRIERAVFSLSTSPSRIRTIAPTIHSLLNQSHAPQRIYVNCPWQFQRTGETFCDTDLMDLKALAPDVICINRCQDDGPISKLLPTLTSEEDPRTFIVILDDDNFYSSDLLERMIHCCQEYPDAIFANSVLPFQEELVIAEGWRGIGIRRGLIQKETFHDFVERAIRHHHCYRSDDLVMSYFFRMCGIPVKRCPQPVASEILQSINSDQHALCKQDQIGHMERYARALEELKNLGNSDTTELHSVCNA